MNFRKYVVCAIAGCLAELSYCGITISFEGGLPSGWTSTSQWKTSSYQGKTYLSSNIQTAAEGTTGLARLGASVAGEDFPECDNVVVDVELSNIAPKSPTLVDAFQVVVSTNSWHDAIPVGEPFGYYDADSDETWVNHRVMAKIDGLKNCSEFSFGLRVIAAGWSSNTIYVRSMTVDYPSGVTCTSIRFEDKPRAGATKLVAVAEINKEPEDTISDLTVWAEIERNGIVYTNQMFEADGGAYTNDILMADSANLSASSDWALDAGEELNLSVFTRYESTMPAIGEYDETLSRYVEKSPVNVYLEVPQVGSVWINEFSFGQVELFGTTNRIYLAGWVLELVDSESAVVARKDFADVFDFTSSMPNRLVGQQTFTLGWQPDSTRGPYSLRLLNSAGVAEHVIAGLLPDAGGRSFGMTGIASWPEDGLAHDWSGTSSNATFTWSVIDPSFGIVNDGQFFEIENECSFMVRTVMKSGTDNQEPFKFATVNYEIEWSSGRTNDVTVTDETGSTPVKEFVGAHTNEDFVTALFNVSAFGWYSEPKEVQLVFGDLNDSTVIELEPTVATDTFSNGRLDSYWNNCGTSDFRYYAGANRNGSARFDARTRTAGTHYAEIKCSNYIMTKGRSHVALSLSACNNGNNGSNSDYAYIQISSNEEFAAGSLIATSRAVYNNVAGNAKGAWNYSTTVLELPEFVDETTPLYVRLRGEAGGWSGLYLDVDNVRIAFQDVAMPTNLTRSVAAPVNGEGTAFTLDVVPQTSDEVQEVSADLHLVLNGVTNIVPFAFADGTLTNAISLVNGEAQAVQMSIAAAALEEALGGPFMTGDEVSYFAAVHYNSANGAVDPEEVYETRYFPDNATTSNEYWIVEGEYGVGDLSANTFTVMGDALSCIGAPEVTTEGVKFTVHGFNENKISSFTVNLNGQDYHPFEGLDTNAQVRVTGEFELPTGLAANTEYTVTITANDVNGNALTPAVFSFVTLPVVTGAVVEPVSQTDVRLSVSGSAAGYVVPSGWTQTSANTWTYGGLTPNSQMTATGIYATNKVGAASAPIDAAPGYTLAAKSTKAPVAETRDDKVSIEVKAGADYVASVDGNPDGTLYALRVATSKGAVNDIAEWKTLADWRDAAVILGAPAIDLTATNYISFVTRNFDEVVTENEAPVVATVWFDMVSAFVDNAAEQQHAASASDPSFGKVAFGLEFCDPAQSEDAAAEVEFKIGDGAWTQAFTFDVPFEELESSTNLLWDAWAAVGQTQGTYSYTLRARVSSGNRHSEWVDVSGTLDFAPPEDMAISGTPGNGVFTSATAYDFALSASDANGVSYGWTLDGAPGTGAAVSGTGAATQNGVMHTLVASATDAMGNTCEPVVRSWTVDTVKPAGLAFTEGPSEGSFAATKSFEFKAAAIDATALTYHWTLNGSAAGDTSPSLSAAAIEGENTVTVYAEDAARNRCDAVTRTWTVDTTDPSKPVVSGTPADGALTNVGAFSLSAASSDATKLTYHWTITGGSGSAGGTGNADFSGTSSEGTNTVSVYATDAAGNKSQTTVLTWTFDSTPPSGLAISGSPAEGSVTADNAVSLTASANDDHDVTYHWTFNGANYVGATLSATSQERGNTATVYAEDAAGNRSEPVVRTWTLDTIKPGVSVLSGTPEAYTNIRAFNIVADSEDNEGGSGVASYVWTLNGNVVVGVTGGTFASELENDGVYVVSVRAVDRAGNEGDAASVSWQLDTAKPNAPVVTGAPNAFTNEKAYSLTAAADDDQNGSGVDYYVWTLNGVEVAGATAAELSGEVEENRDYTVCVHAVDKAGNAGDATAVSWKLDTVKPTLPSLSGVPDQLTNNPEYSLAASSYDVNGVAAYHWMLNYEAVAGFSADVLSGTASEDREYTVCVWAADQAGNVSPTNTVSWTLDTTPPAKPSVTGLPASPTNVKEFTLTASGSADLNGFAYKWIFGVQRADGETFDVVTSADVDYEILVYALDNAGNSSATNSVSWKRDATAPALPVVTGTPEAGSVVNEKAFSYTALSEDDTDVTYHWTFGAREDALAQDVPFAGNAAEGTNTVGVYATDLAGNVSATNTFSWVLDTINPSDPVILGKPAKLSKVPEFTMSATSQDATLLTFHWTIEGGTGAASGYEYASFTGTSAEGPNTVRVYATDEAGNRSETVEYVWNLDTTRPTDLAVEGTSGVVAAIPFSFTASANDATDVTFHWSSVGGGAGAASGEGDAVFSGNAVEGTNTVSVYAEDAAGNRCDPLELMWVVDTVKPANLRFAEKPDALTNIPAFRFVATADDATRLTYHWTVVAATGSASGEGDSVFSGTAEEGPNSVSVYATDEAGNVSETVKYDWIRDTTAPAKLNVEGTSGAVGSLEFDFTASAEDDSKPISYRWLLNGVEADEKGATFSGTVPEGTNTVGVSAIDAAGNECGAIERIWVADVTAPVIGEPTGLPGEITNVKNFTLETGATDNLTKVTYYWSFGNGPFVSGVNTYDVATEDDVSYVVKVYAMDEAGNSSATNVVEWALDTVAPNKPVISGLPGSPTHVKSFKLTASDPQDEDGVTYRWTFGGAVSEEAELNVVTDAEGEYTASVVAVDAAENESEAASVSWRLDVTPPQGLAVSGTPGEGAATADAAFDFTASADDDSTPLSFIWTINGQVVDGNATSNYVGTAVENATNVVTVVAVDAAGNESDKVTRTWVVDKTAPEMPEFDVKPGNPTNTREYTLAVSSTDELTGVTGYFWSFNGGEFEAGEASLKGEVSEDREYTVKVYAVDAAGNSSATNSWSWIVDTVKPKVVELRSNTPDPFNANDTFMVTVEFTEPVADFDADKVTVVNGTVGSVTESQDPQKAKKQFDVTITPDSDDVMSISVQVEADKVADLAGNGNEASDALSRNCVLKRPTVGLSTTLTTDFFHKGEMFGVSVVFSQAVTNFSAASVTVVNGTVAVSGSGAEYTMTVTPTADGEVSVQIGENKVYDSAGNGNVASATLKKTYDNTAPTGIVLSGTPENGSETYTREYSITVQSVVEANASAGLVYQWSVDGGSYKTGNVTLSGTAAPGEHTVKVRIRDKAGNWSLVDHSPTWKWTVLESETSADVEFGGGICVKVDPETGVTNSVSFTSVDFRPGEASTFVLEGFDASTQQIEDFNMWFVVKDALDGEERRVKVNPTATFDSDKGELTVTVPADAIEGKDSLFIFGIDNKE